MPEERKSSDKEVKTSNIIGAVAVAMALLLAIAITIPIKAEDTITEIRIVRPGPYETFPTWTAGRSVNWKWTDPLGREITVQRMYSTGQAIYTDRWTTDGTSHTNVQYLFRKNTGPEQTMFVINSTDPHQNTKVEVTYTAGASTEWINTLLEYNPYPDPLGITTRVITMPTGKYTQIVIGNPEFTDTPDHIFIEYRRYTSDTWELYAQTEINALLPDFTYYGDGTDTEYVTPGYYRARYAWMPPPESSEDPTYSGYVYTDQVGPSFAPDLTYPDITLPDAPEAIQVDPSINPLPHIWSSALGTTLTVIVIAVLTTAVSAYFVYGRS